MKNCTYNVFTEYGDSCAICNTVEMRIITIVVALTEHMSFMTSSHPDLGSRWQYPSFDGRGNGGSDRDGHCSGPPAVELRLTFRSAPKAHLSGSWFIYANALILKNKRGKDEYQNINIGG